jgi:hypothetical protein
MEQRVHPEAHSSRNYSDASILKMRVRIIPKKAGKRKAGSFGKLPALYFVYVVVRREPHRPVPPGWRMYSSV